MDNQRLVNHWHAAIINDCLGILGRKLREPERQFITARGGVVAPEMIHDQVKSLARKPEELAHHLNSEAVSHDAKAKS